MNEKEIAQLLKKYINDSNEDYFYVLSTADTDIKVTHKNTHNKLIQFLNEELEIDLDVCLTIDRNIEKILDKLEEE